LPGAGASVAQRLQESDLVMHRFPLESGAALETGCVYLVPLAERLDLPSGIAAAANPKSSTGRLDVYTRMICDGAARFDAAPAGYRGPLYLEISPRTFSVLARPGDRLAQLRLREGAPAPLRELTLGVDLAGEGRFVGFRARRHSRIIDLSRTGAHDPAHYWEPLTAERGRLVLDPEEFYILASAETVEIGENEAAEMAPVAPEIGEFRAHYAGFFDPGFGVGAPSRAVLEVRGRDVPFVLEHGQPAARLVYEAMTQRPRTLYGAAGSHYQAQGLKLGKHFADWQSGLWRPDFRP
jgi:dCTP deaminase